MSVIRWYLATHHVGCHSCHVCSPVSAVSPAGAVYEVFAFKFNLGHVSNAVSLWLGMRPSDIFVYVFFPPFLLDLASRIDFYMLKKVRCDRNVFGAGCQECV